MSNPLSMSLGNIWTYDMTGRASLFPTARSHNVGEQRAHATRFRHAIPHQILFRPCLADGLTGTVQPDIFRCSLQVRPSPRDCKLMQAAGAPGVLCGTNSLLGDI